MVKLQALETEQRNASSMTIDRMSTIEVLETINQEDKLVPQVIQEIIPQIALAVDAIYEQLKQGGRLIYMGAGTSGRLGILDASECPPTYGVDPTLIQGLIAGGTDAIQNAVEGAEDSMEYGKTDLIAIELSKEDVVCGLAASGRTPYVIGALQYANQVGAKTISISCVKDSEISQLSMYPIEAVVGPEVITGSTRMKAGTAQKLILNMLSTSVMIKLGKVYSNLMVDVKASNEKLVARAKQIISISTGCSADEAALLFEQSGGMAKVAIFMYLTKCTKEEGIEYLNNNENISQAVMRYFEQRGQ